MVESSRTYLTFKTSMTRIRVVNITLSVVKYNVLK